MVVTGYLCVCVCVWLSLGGRVWLSWWEGVVLA